MIIDWVGRTRKFLGADDFILRLQPILRCLSEYIGNVLVIDKESDDARTLDLRGDNELATCILGELHRSEYRKQQLLTLGIAEIPHHRPLGSLYLSSQDGSKGVHLRFDQYELAPVLDELRFGNTFCIESDEISVSGTELAKLTMSVMRTVFDNDLFDHGYCCPSDEYDAKNLDRSDGGVCAVGLDASKWLPGFYWANYFGAYLRELIGEDVLMTVPGCHSTQLTSGVLLANKLPPDRWSDPEYLANARAAINHIGPHLFFEKGKSASGSGTLFTQ